MSDGIVRKDEIVQNIGKCTLIQPVDVRAVLDVLHDEVVDALLAGRKVILEDFLGVTTSFELLDPDAATKADAALLPNDVTLRVNATVKPSVVRRVRERLSLEQTITRIRQPQIEQVFDHLTQTMGQYTPGGAVDVRGKDIDLPEDFKADPTQGVFFIDGSGTTRAEVYISEGNKRITCVVPPEVSGPVTIEVRSTYGGPTLRTGKVENIPQG